MRPSVDRQLEPALFVAQTPNAPSVTQTNGLGQVHVPFLLALGSDELQKQGYSRKGSENVVGPMPPMGTVVKSGDDLWKIIAWIRSVNPSSAGSSPSASASPPSAPAPQ